MAKTALISGGAKGIGRCLVRRFCERGYKVFILDIDEEELKYTVNTHLKQYTDDHMLGYSICDLSDVKDIQEKVKAAAQFLGRIEVLVNNGGLSRPHWSDGQTMADDIMGEWQAYMDTNLTGPFTVSRSCLPYMRSDESPHDISDAGPCIIHIGSFRAFTSDARQEAYSSTKAGLLGLTHSMAISLGPLGIRVNLVAPGRIKVAHECKEGDSKGMQWADLNEEKDIEDHATNRAGRPKDVADAVEYLVGAGFVTGQSLTVDGGATKKKSG